MNHPTLNFDFTEDAQIYSAEYWDKFENDPKQKHLLKDYPAIDIVAQVNIYVNDSNIKGEETITISIVNQTFQDLNKDDNESFENIRMDATLSRGQVQYLVNHLSSFLENTKP